MDYKLSNKFSDILKLMKKIVVIAVIIIIISGGFIYLLTTNQSSELVETEPSTSSSQAEPESNNQNASLKNDSYVEYSDAALANADGERILFFHAEWCPQCKALEKSIKESTIPDDTTIFEVDYDTNQNLRQQYGVTLQTTLVSIDENGNLINKYIAYDNPTWQAVESNLL